MLLKHLSYADVLTRPALLPPEVQAKFESDVRVARLAYLFEEADRLIGETEIGDELCAAENNLLQKTKAGNVTVVDTARFMSAMSDQAAAVIAIVFQELERQSHRS